MDPALVVASKPLSKIAWKKSEEFDTYFYFVYWLYTHNPRDSRCIQLATNNGPAKSSLESKESVALCPERMLEKVGRTAVPKGIWFSTRSIPLKSSKSHSPTGNKGDCETERQSRFINPDANADGIPMRLYKLHYGCAY